MVNYLNENKSTKIPNFSGYRRSFLYTPCNCPMQNCEFNCVSKSYNARQKYRTTRRIRKLAKPKDCTIKFYQRPVSHYGRNIQLIRAYEEPHASTRLQQLAIPKVRKLIAARNAYRQFLNRSWYERLGKRINRSMFTVYSRLANVKLPESKSKSHKMSPEQWQQHQQWLSRNAQPKPRKELKTKPSKKLPLHELEVRLMSLSMPRGQTQKYRGPAKFQPVSPGALKATASDRLKALCIPTERHRRAKGPIVENTAIPENVLQAEASPRVIELSKPKIYRNVRNDYRENPFTVEPRALKANASDRVLELAKPKKAKK